ncbi:MAG: NAD-dependent epimerase/dehydratase family protein, partial [Bacteroidetes bacterium]
LERESLEKAAKGCDAVLHVAAYAKPWAPDPQTFHRINVEGARRVFELTRGGEVGRVVFTSTAGVISPSDGRPSDEATPRRIPLSTDYERSKAEAEALAREFVERGADIVIVNPTRVYGPGLLSDSNGVTRMVKLWLEGKFRFLPGDGNSIGNYVFIEDVVEGHLLALDKGKPGERYILGGDNASFREFFHLLEQLTGRRRRMVSLPIPLMHLAARMMEWRANLLGTPPLLTPPWVKKYLYHWELSVEKARRELGYDPLPLKEGLRRTLQWLQKPPS